MGRETLLTIEQAAAASGFGKKALRTMVRDGSLPAVRRDGCWHVAAADLLSLSGTRSTRAAVSATKPRLSAERPAEPASPPADVLPPSHAAAQGLARRHDREEVSDGAIGKHGAGGGTAIADRPILQVKGAGKIVPGVAQAAADAPRAELLAVLAMLVQRDAQIAALQDERAHLYAQLGLLQGVLAERDGRLRPLKAQRVAKPYREDGSATTALAEPAQGSVGTQGASAASQAPTDTTPERTGAGVLAHLPEGGLHGSLAIGRKPGGTIVGAATMPVAVQRRLVHSIRRFLGLRN